MQKLFSLFISIIFSFSLIAQNSLNIEQVGHLPYNDGLSDVWGYVDGTDEYALVGTHNGFSIVDVTDPANPTEVYFEPGPNSIWRDAFVYNDHMYGVTEGGGGLVIIDLSPLPGSTSLTSTTYTGTNVQWETAHNLFIDENGICYIFGSDYSNGGAIMLDLTQDPMNPVEVGVFDQHYIHDGTVRGDTLWAAFVYQGAAAAIDVSNKSNPQIMVTWNTPNNFAHNIWMDENNNYAYTTDEVSNGYIGAYDVSDFNNIIETDRYQSGHSDEVIPHNTHYLNSFLYNSYYLDGLTIVDVQRPHNIVEVGFYDTAPNMAGEGFDGCWGTYPFLPSGNILASDVSNGLFILAFNGTEACFLEGNVTDASNNAPLNNVYITVSSINLNDSTNLSGEYATGTPTAGTYTVEFSKGGYLPETITGVTLSNGNVTTLDVQLTPDVPFTMQGQVIEAGSGNGVEGATVQLNSPSFQHEVTTDNQGNFQVPTFFAGDYDVTAGKWGYVTECNSESITSTSGTLIIELDKGYYDDFALDFDWTTSGTASTGMWERAEPNGTSFQGVDCNPGEDVSGECGDKAYVTGNGGGSAGDDDIDGGTTVLTSPTFDLTTYQNPHIHLSRWFYNGGGQGSLANDPFRIKLTDGSNEVVLEEVIGIDFDNSQWLQRSFKVSDFMTPSATTQIIVESADDAPGHLVEAGLDLFFVVDSTNIGISEEAGLVNINAFPNPFTSEITVTYEIQNNTGENIHFQITDITGKVISQNLITDRSGRLVIGSDLPSGVYMLKLMEGAKTIAVRKIMRL